MWEGETMETNVLRRKICLLGDTAVGKTSLIRRFVQNEFSDDYISTVGAKVTKKDMRINIPELGGEYELSLTIWDVLGQISYRSLQSMFFKGASGAIIVCDRTRKDTLSGLEKWIESLYAVTKPVPLILLANKCDLEEQFQFDMEELAPVADMFNSYFFESSAKTGQNVDRAFNHIAKLLVSIYFLKRKQSQ